MAENKFTAVVKNIATKVGELVSADGSGVLKAVKRAVIVPANAGQTPTLGIVLGDFTREDGFFWSGNLMLMLVASKGGKQIDESVVDLCADVTAKIDALVTAGTAGGRVDAIKWQTWYQPGENPAALDNVGAIGQARIVVENPLK